jgi:hypothetical protein
MMLDVLIALVYSQLYSQPNSQIDSLVAQKSNQTTSCQIKSTPNFLVIGGGGAPSYNEIALEKNLLYFQRSLKAMGYEPTQAKMFFANGNNGEPTVRYMDNGVEKFKPPAIPNLNGASTYRNLKASLLADRSLKPLFFYFTGHGSKNRSDRNNNFMLLWEEQSLSVKQFARILDQLPVQKPIVSVMSQCYAGSFANYIYKGGDPSQPIALQSRCGFFATIKTLTSVGCTPEVNEADYIDYSSSFYAGLTGRNRINKPVASADYNSNGKVGYNEAHAFAKIDNLSTDLPISTSEAWLQNQASQQNQYAIFSKPIKNLLTTARPEQRYVVNSLLKTFDISSDRSFRNSKDFLTNNPKKLETDVQQTYLIRLQMELTNIGMEQQIRASQNQDSINILNRLIKCESASWE